MILDSTSLKLEAVLGGAVAANQPEVTVVFINYNVDGAPSKPATVRSALNSSTDVTILAAPSVDGHVREPQFISIYNKDTASVTVTVKTDDGTTERILHKATLATLEALQYEKGRGWYALTSSGAVKNGQGKSPTRQVFTSGSGTYTTPSGCAAIDVELIGGGGGAGGSGTGGGSGTAGNNTTFSTLTGSGGGAGAGAGGATGAGGAAAGGDVNIPGGSGGSYPAQAVGSGGAGGNGFFGGGAAGNSPGAAGLNGATNSGGGGSGGTIGGSTSTSTGGQGGGAGGYVRKFIASPAATYSYSVGGTAAGGSAGTNGFAGGSGAAGIIIVTEFYT